MRRTAILIGSVAAAIILSKLLIENVMGLSIEAIATAWLSRPGAGTAITVVALLAADLFLPIPSSIVMVLSGAAFGVIWGALLALVGSVGGEWLGFELVRYYGRRASTRIVGDDEIDRLSRVFAQHGAAAVAVTRALPVVMETMSVVAGLSTMQRRTFLLASLIGTGPIVFVYAWAGAVSRQTGNALPAAIMLIAVAAFGWVLYRAKISD
ncbi:MAG TPA: VTT domain-containing protein [Vicinamibacterales bacterium]|nr:VTT domain-containing protein [Vicinamibacterales bacterium]